MAVPHAVGIASLLWEKDLTKSSYFIKGLLEASAKKINDDSGKYLYVDYSYAEKIYDDYCEMFASENDIENINNDFENTDSVADYSDTVTGSWGKVKHADMAEEACNEMGGLTAKQIKIVKLGARAPDDHCPAAEVPTHRMFHALDDYNYVKVYEHIMNMSQECKNVDHEAAMNLGFPDGYAGDYNECVTVRDWLGEKEIKVMLTDEYEYKKKNASLIMLGVAMHVLSDTYAHRSYELMNDNTLIRITNQLFDEDGKKATDSPKYVKARFECAEDSCEWALTNWLDDTEAFPGDYLSDAKNSTGYTGSDGRKFRLERLYEFSIDSPNGFDLSGYFANQLSNRSCQKDYSQY